MQTSYDCTHLSAFTKQTILNQMEVLHKNDLKPLNRILLNEQSMRVREYSRS